MSEEKKKRPPINWIIITLDSEPDNTIFRVLYRQRHKGHISKLWQCKKCPIRIKMTCPKNSTRKFFKIDTLEPHTCVNTDFLNISKIQEEVFKMFKANKLLPKEIFEKLVSQGKNIQICQIYYLKSKYKRLLKEKKVFLN